MALRLHTPPSCQQLSHQNAIDRHPFQVRVGNRGPGQIHIIKPCPRKIDIVKTRPAKIHIIKPCLAQTNIGEARSS